MNNGEYNPSEIEKKWQKYWKENQTYTVADSAQGKENFYALSEFSYPSGNLHVGHWYAFAVPDIYARYKRMLGYNVLYPMGFDSFGLPAENAAIKHNRDPREWTYSNMEYMRKQLESMGASFDWKRTLATSDPDYYKWTQWMFNEFFKNDLVYRDITKVNWCEHDKTILANEQVVAGACERCGNQVVQKDMAQWMLKITDFADELYNDLEDLPWDESIKQAQREWIGRKEGSLIPFKINNATEKQKVVLLHGFTATSQDDFHPWLKEELEKQGYLVESPDLPDTKNPNVQNQINYVLDNISFDKNTILLGHSLGTVVAMKVAEKIRLKQLILIAPFIDGEFKDYVRPFSDTFDYKFDFKKIKENSSEIKILEDINDVVISEVQIQRVCNSLNTKSISVTANKSHFCASLEPEVLKLFDSEIKVFTTRADTLFGATYLVLAPEHEMVQNLKIKITNWDEVETYIKEVEKKSDLERQQSKEKTGVELKGITAINPATQEEISVWIADYVLNNFGTGAVMAVPAHDERDCEFALKYNLPFKFVVLPSAGPIGNSRPLITSGENAFILSAGTTEKKGGQEQINAEWNAMYDLLGTCNDGILPEGKRFCCNFEGKLINSPGFNTKATEKVKELITKAVKGEITKTYRLRDWGISRQRYWGCPIPIVYDPEGKAHPVPKEHLPWILPDDVDFTPDGTAPLARSKELLRRTEEIFGKGWTPEVDTMDTFVDSSWYFYRYLDNQNDREFASEKSMKSWMPIDKYFGGAEHTTMHLLYSRFWTKALHKLGYISHSEPYKERLNRGLILGPDGAKMSKSKGNVIDPDEVVSHVGADTVRMYLAFIGPFNEPGNYPWDPNGVVGVRRFLDRVWRLQSAITDTTPKELYVELQATIKKVGEDIERLKLNTAISTMMTFVNKAEKAEGIAQKDFDTFIQLLAPFAPHMTEELWMQGHNSSIHHSTFPQYDESKIISSHTMLPIQINGKVRAQITVEEGEDSSSLEKRVLEIPDVQKWMEGKDLKKFIYVPGKIINIVI